jgi:O-antigen/teichoic acid export membrane protein
LFGVTPTLRHCPIQQLIRYVQLERRILGNATSMGVSAVIGQLANFGFVILLARGFGRDIFAQYALSMAIGALACVLVSFGSISLLVRSSAQDISRGLEMLRAILPVQVLMGLIVWVATLALGVILSMTAVELSILGCIVGHHVIIRITAVLLTPLQGQERMDIVAVIQVGRNVLALATGVTLALTTGSAVASVSAMPIASIVFLVYASAKVQGLLGPIAWKWDPKAARHVVMQALPFLLIVALSTGNQRLGVLMLSVIQGNDALATFASGERIITSAAVLYTMLTVATLPAASRLALSDSPRHHELVNRVARLVMLVVLPAAITLVLFSDDIIGLLFGSEFATSAHILRIVAWVLVIRAVSSIQEMAAISTERQRVIVIGRSYGLVLLLLLGLPLIWMAGPFGLAFAMLGAEIGYVATLQVLLRRAAVAISPLSSSLRTVAACGFTLVVGMIAANLDLLPRAVLLVGCVIAGLWGFGAVRPHDLRYLLTILRTKRADYLGID